MTALPLKWTRPVTAAVLAAVVVVVAASTIGLIYSHRTTTVVIGSLAGPQANAAADLQAVVAAAPYHVFVSTRPGFTLVSAEGERRRFEGHHVYEVNLAYFTTHGTLHVWMAERSWIIKQIGYDFTAVGAPTTIAGTAWRLQTVRQVRGPQLQLARSTPGDTVLEIDGFAGLPTISKLAESLH